MGKWSFGWRSPVSEAAAAVVQPQEKADRPAAPAAERRSGKQEVMDEVLRVLQSGKVYVPKDLVAIIGEFVRLPHFRQAVSLISCLTFRSLQVPGRVHRGQGGQQDRSEELCAGCRTG